MQSQGHVRDLYTVTLNWKSTQVSGYSATRIRWKDTLFSGTWLTKLKCMLLQTSRYSWSSKSVIAPVLICLVANYLPSYSNPSIFRCRPDVPVKLNFLASKFVGSLFFRLTVRGVAELCFAHGHYYSQCAGDGNLPSCRQLYRSKSSEINSVERIISLV